jgi:hypothetical protein
VLPSKAMTNSSGVRPSVIDAANRAGGWPVTTRRKPRSVGAGQRIASCFRGSRCFGPCRHPPQIRRGAYRVWPQSFVARPSQGPPNVAEIPMPRPHRPQRPRGLGLPDVRRNYKGSSIPTTERGRMRSGTTHVNAPIAADVRPCMREEVMRRFVIGL